MAVVALLVVGYASLGVCLHLALRVHIVYSHAAYIPIVLAGMWWGRKGLGVAGLVACLPVCFHLFGIASAPLWSNVTRMFFFMAVAVAVCELSEKVGSSAESVGKIWAFAILHCNSNLT